MAFTEAEKKKFLADIKEELRSDIVKILREGVSDVSKGLKKDIQRLRGVESGIIHFVGDDEVRCMPDGEHIVCSHKVDGKWKQVNSNKVNELIMMQYVNREKQCYGLDCEMLKDTIDCNYVSKDRLEKIEKPVVPAGLSWTGTPGFRRLSCKSKDGVLSCSGSPEMVLGMIDEEYTEKLPDTYDKDTGSWLKGELVTKTRKIPSYIGEIPFSETGKMISFTTKDEKDLNGLTFVELDDHTMVGFLMKGKPFMDAEPESRMWAVDEDASKIGQGFGSKRRKNVFSDIERIKPLKGGKKS